MAAKGGCSSKVARGLVARLNLDQLKSNLGGRSAKLDVSLLVQDAPSTFTRSSIAEFTWPGRESVL